MNKKLIVITKEENTRRLYIVQVLTENYLYMSRTNKKDNNNNEDDFSISLIL